MRQAQRLDDRLFGHFLGPGFHHDDGVPGTGHDEVELALLHLVDRWADNQLVVEHPDADGPDRPLEGDRGDRERQRGAVDGHGGRIGVLVDGEHGRDHLHVIAEVLREERTDGSVDQAAVENGLLAGTSLAADEAARDLARRIELLLVVAGERKEVDPLPRRRRHHGGDEQHGVAHTHGDCA